jgi:hypothetical protein
VALSVIARSGRAARRDASQRRAEAEDHPVRRRNGHEPHGRPVDHPRRTSGRATVRLHELGRVGAGRRVREIDDRRVAEHVALAVEDGDVRVHHQPEPLGELVRVAPSLADPLGRPLRLLIEALVELSLEVSAKRAIQLQHDEEHDRGDERQVAREELGPERQRHGIVTYTPQASAQTASGWSGWGAGPPVTAPVRSKVEPWHGHWNSVPVVPAYRTLQQLWEQPAPNATYLPADACTTITKSCRQDGSAYPWIWNSRLPPTCCRAG